MNLNGPADLALVGGPIYVAGGRADAVAIASDESSALDRAVRWTRRSIPSTEVIDLAGRAVYPGFNDAHVHPIDGGLERLRCDLTPYLTADEYVDAIARYARSNPDLPWITGGGWNMSAFPGGTPTAEQLDEAVDDRPVFIFNRDHHGAWVNSKAFEMARIDSGTVDPPDGRIERDLTGAPSGTLHEGATNLVEKLLPETTEEDLIEGLLEGQRYLHSLGITAWQDAIVGEMFQPRSTLPTYLRTLGDGRLTARVRGALWLSRDATADALETFVALARRSARRWLRCGFDQDHAGRRDRELHRGDARALPRPDGWAGYQLLRP